MRERVCGESQLHRGDAAAALTFCTGDGTAGAGEMGEDAAATRSLTAPYESYDVVVERDSFSTASDVAAAEV